MKEKLRKSLREKGRAGKLRVLVAAAECTPLAKSGGLADVVGALPKYLNKLGFDARIIIPYHRVIKEKYASVAEHLVSFSVDLGWRSQYVGVEKLTLDGVAIYLIDNEFYFGGPIYRGGEAEGEQYAFFQRAVLEALPYIDFIPDVLHCNDWHTAMLPFLIKTQYAFRPQGGIRTLMTIHNIAYQGKFSFEFVQDLLGVDRQFYTPDKIELFGCADFLKAGCVYADAISTVSPTYAQEICDPYYGEGLEGILNARRHQLHGNLNGLDTDFFDPAADKALPCPFSPDVPDWKQRNKDALRFELGLSSPPETPLVAMVTRMTAQKGFDLVERVLDDLMANGIDFVLLGTGDKKYEDFMRQAESRYKGRLCAYIAYHEDLSHRIYAAADLFLMPSKFEPCGISQMIAMRYGALPIVRETGGLRDTVIPYNQYTGEGTGFTFANYNAHEMADALWRALEAWRSPEARQRLINNAMAQDFSFLRSAYDYGQLFISLL